MVRGFYSAASGVLTKQRTMNVISNNISNVATTGYKSQATVESSFREHLVSRRGVDPQSNIGPGAFMTVNISEYTDHSQGTLESTGRSVDLAILGEGFFLVDSQSHGEVLTRNGQFEIDEEGDLILPGVGKVLDYRGREISIRTNDFSVEKDGTIRVDRREVARLFIGVQDGEGELVRVGKDTYLSEEGYRALDDSEYRLVQGYVERSNVNLSEEMSKIIATQSNFHSCAQILKIYDRINEISVNSLGEVR
ncbi:MAG: flagellar hook-basal body protein [Clostridiales bacterium]|nr:flagellar hook-basal body protein [Clostridiales bacterium]